MSSDDSLADMAAVAGEGSSRPPSSTLGTSTPTLGTTTISQTSPQVPSPSPEEKPEAGNPTKDEGAEAGDQGSRKEGWTSSFGEDGPTDLKSTFISPMAENIQTPITNTSFQECEEEKAQVTTGKEGEGTTISKESEEYTDMTDEQMDKQIAELEQKTLMLAKKTSLTDDATPQQSSQGVSSGSWSRVSAELRGEDQEPRENLRQALSRTFNKNSGHFAGALVPDPLGAAEAEKPKAEEDKEAQQEQGKGKDVRTPTVEIEVEPRARGKAEGNRESNCGLDVPVPGSLPESVENDVQGIEARRVMLEKDIEKLGMRISVDPEDGCTMASGQTNTERGRTARISDAEVTTQGAGSSHDPGPDERPDTAVEEGTTKRKIDNKQSPQEESPFGGGALPNGHLPPASSAKRAHSEPKEGGVPERRPSIPRWATAGQPSNEARETGKRSIGEAEEDEGNNATARKRANSNDPIDKARGPNEGITLPPGLPAGHVPRLTGNEKAHPFGGCGLPASQRSSSPVALPDSYDKAPSRGSGLRRTWSPTPLQSLPSLIVPAAADQLYKVKAEQEKERADALEQQLQNSKMQEAKYEEEKAAMMQSIREKKEVDEKVRRANEEHTESLRRKLSQKEEQWHDLRAESERLGQTANFNVTAAHAQCQEMLHERCSHSKSYHCKPYPGKRQE